MITAEMIRQYFYCPRKIYWREIFSKQKLRTPQITRGTRIHEKVWYGRKIIKKKVNRIEELQRKVHLKSEKLQITGIVDAIIIKKVNNEVTSVIPIEVKTGSTNTKRPEKQHVMQLVAYILMAQEKWGKEKVKHGYIIYKDSKEKYRIEISEELERELIEAISNIKKILAEETLPPPTRNPRKCEPCEYRKYCKRI